MKKSQLIKKCKDMGVMLIDDGETIRIDAPVGFTFRSGLHWYDHSLRGWTRPEAYAELAVELGDRLLECRDALCHACGDGAMTFDETLQMYPGERLA